MPTPNPPSLIWQQKVDAPINQDASYRMNSLDRSYIDSQILGCETLLLRVLNESSPQPVPGRFVYTGSIQQIEILGAPGVEQLVYIDGTAGIVALLMPEGCVDGQRVTGIDSKGYFETHTPTFAPPDGVTIADPNSGGTFSSGAVSAVAMNASDPSWVWGEEENSWLPG